MTQLTATFTVTIKTKPDGDYYFDHDDLVRNVVPWIEGGLDDRDDIAEVTITEQATEEAHAELRHARAALARIRQMADYWEQHLPEVIRTPAVVSALRAAMERAESAAVSAAVAPPTQTALRDRIAEALMQWAEGNNSPKYTSMRRPETVVQNAYSRADAVLAVLPEVADKATVYREAADQLGCMDYDTDSNDYGYDTYRDAWNGGVMDAADRLRRMADETATETPAAPAPTHLGNRANAEDCPACKAEARNLPYPFLCPDEPDAGARQDGAHQ